MKYFSIDLDMLMRTCLAVACFLCLCCNQQKAEWPAINKETKPWTRWWWQGSAVTKEGITAELEAFAKAGLGGVEITPIYGVKGSEDKFIPYLSDAWVELLLHTLSEAKRLDLGVDMATGTGWPFGGPWVGDEFASKNVHHKIYELSGGKRLKEKIEFVQAPLLRTVNPVDVSIKDLRQPISQNTNLQQLAIDQVQFERKLPLVALMAYSDGGEVVDLKSDVGADGTLDWSPPNGKWKIYALFQGWHGKMVERAGPGGEGNVIDHFSRKAIDRYLAHFDSAFNGRDISSLRAFFNDSYEVDDARGAADWTPELFDAFKTNRGYDLHDHLNELFDSASVNGERVLYDYRLTISELLLNNFTQPWTSWANKHQAITRNQAHGSPANILDLYSTVDIPEIEGTQPLRIRMATSAANVSGKTLVSSESATWLNEHFESSLGDVKSAVDQFLINGVNHIFYHGTCYSPQDEPWPGWLFYAAVHLNQRNPQWVDFDVLNKYVARCQSFLQNSKADNDILLYYPIADPMSKFGPEMIEHFDGIGKQFQGSEFEHIAEMLLKKGYTFDFISDKQIAGVKDDKLIVIPTCKYMPVETVNNLNSLAEQGKRILLLGWPPQYFAGLSEKDQKPMFSKKVFVGYELYLAPETMTELGLQFNRRKMDDGRSVYLVRNPDKPLDDFIFLNRRGNYLLYDPMTGLIGKPEVKNGKIRVQLDKGQTIIAVQSDSPADPFAYTQTIGKPVTLNLDWTITIGSGTVASWPDDFSGVATYKTHFTLPQNPNGGWLLDLGEVHETATVSLNGREIARLITPPFRVKIEPSMAQTDNVLEVRIANLMANGIASLDRKGIPWKKFYNINFPARFEKNRKDGLFDASEWVPRPSGLLGPVQLLLTKDGVKR